MSRITSSQKKKSVASVPAPASVPTNPPVAPLTPYQPDSDLQKMGDQAQEYLEDYAFKIVDPAPSGQRINWKRSKRELADHMATLLRDGVIEARNEADLLRQIVKHFVVQGETLDENSLRTNLADLRNDRRGYKK